MSSESELTGLLNKCVSLIDTEQEIGTGFFVAPGLILTCAHVVRVTVDRREPVCVIYGGKKYVAKSIKSNEIFIEDDKDLALLRIDLKKHPCVLLGITESRANADLHSYGFTLVEGDQGEQKIVVEEFKARFEGERKELKADLTFGSTLAKFREGQVRSGYSGAPLLDVGSGVVSGVVNMTRGTGTDLGGFAVPTQTVFSLFPKLKKLNEKFHKENTEWTQLTQGIKARKPSNPISVRLYTEPRTLARPENFVERNDLLNQIEKQLEKQTARLNVDGMAGIGKTTLAYQVIARRLDNKKGAVLWVEVGSASPEEVIDAIPEDGYKNLKLLSEAPDFQSKKEILHHFFEDELKNERISLIVLDNVIEGSTWLELSDSFPEKLPVLITSRTRFAVKEIVDVGQLSPAQALYMLEKTVGDENYSNDKDAAFLCELFGYHPLAIEILGANMKEVPLSPQEQRRRLEKEPARLKSELHEDRLWVLFEDSVTGLGDLERSIFQTLGEFPINGITLYLLAMYLRQSSEDLLEALDHLGKRNLVKKRPEADFYFLHDVIFHYVKSRAKLVEKNKNSLIRAVLSYLKKYQNEFDLIKQDAANLLAIAGLSKRLYLVQIMSWLTIGGYPTPGPDSYFENKGHPTAFLEKLDQAIQACRRMDDCPTVSLHYLLGKRGDVYFNMGNYQNALSCYEEVISLAPNENRQAILYSVAGRTYAIWGNFQKAKRYFQEAYKIAGQSDNNLLLISIMGQESHAAGAMGNYKKVKEFAKRQEVLVQKILNIDPSPQANKQLFFALLNQGAAEMELAKQGKGSFQTAFNILEHAQGVALSQKSDVLLAYAFDSIGEVCHYLKNELDAKNCFEQSLNLWRKLGMLKDVKELEVRMLSLGYAVPA